MKPMDIIRARIAMIDGPFDYMDVASEYKNAHIYVRNMVKTGEVVIVGKGKGNSRKRNIYQRVPICSDKKSRDPWANIWPEFFVAPNLKGRGRIIQYDSCGRVKEVCL